MDFAELNKRLGAEWKAFTELEKRPYFLEAKKISDQHKVDHPDYVFRPRKKRSAESKIANARSGLTDLPVTVLKAELNKHGLLKENILQNEVSNVSEFLHPPPKRLVRERAHLVVQT